MESSQKNKMPPNMPLAGTFKTMEIQGTKKIRGLIIL